MSVNFSQFIENRIANIQSSDSFAFAAAIGLGPWLCPIAPAIIFGYALFVSAPVDMGQFRIVTATAVAVGLVVAGAVSSHNAIVAAGWGPWGLVIGYIGLEIIGLWLMGVSFDVKVVGTVASLLTLIVYLSRSSAKVIDDSRSEAGEMGRLKLDYQMSQARQAAEHKREMARLRAEQKHAQKLAEISQLSAGKLPEPSGRPSETNGNLPEWLPMLPETLPEFRKLVGSGSARLPDDMTGAELGRIIGKSPRTGQNWLTAVRNGADNGNA
jgi:hypothetical protein